MTSHRHGPEAFARRRAPPWIAALALAAALGCAAAVANRPAPGTMAGGTFTPGRPPAKEYGGDATTGCPSAGPFKLFSDDLAASAKSAGKPPPQPDGRLCAAAEAFLGWEDPELPPESVARFVSSYFGLPSPISRVVIATLETDDSRVIADRLVETASKFAAQATQPRYGLATQRLGRARGDRREQQTSKASTKVALVMQDAAVDLQPVPRQVPLNGALTVSGKLLGGRTNPKVLACTAAGKLLMPAAPAAQSGDGFGAELACGERPGLMEVEVRADKDGATSTAARFAVACGTEPPKSAPAPAQAAAGQAQRPAPEQERGMFDLMNGVRKEAGLQPLEWDDAVASVARSASESYRSQSSGDFDVSAKLKQNDIASLSVLQNPVAAPDVAEAHALLASSPVNHCNLLNREVTHAGVGVVQAADPNGRPLLYVTELLVRELPAVDPEAVRAKLREAIKQKRADARAAPVASDPVLEGIAQKYAGALAATKGNLPKAEESQIVAPLYKSYRSVNILSGAKPEPLEFAEEPGVTQAAKVMGVGAAQGANPVLGKNAVYVVILVGDRR